MLERIVHVHQCFDSIVEIVTFDCLGQKVDCCVVENHDVTRLARASIPEQLGADVVRAASIFDVITCRHRRQQCLSIKQFVLLSARQLVESHFSRQQQATKSTPKTHRAAHRRQRARQ
jgi:hypothetical protein